MKSKITTRLLMLLTLSASLTACSLDDSDDNNNSTYVDNVAIVKDNGQTYFMGSGGDILIPSPAYLNSENAKTAFVQFKILSDLSSGTTKKYSVQLLYAPVKIDATVNKASTEAGLDSLRNDSIVGINSGSFIHDNYLVLGINYMLYNRTHYFTLCYAENKSFIASGNSNRPDTLRFFLHHNANNDLPSNNTSSNNYVYYNKVSAYFMGYDIKDMMTETLKKNGGKNLYVDVQYRACAYGYTQCTTKHVGFNYPLTSQK